MIVPVIQYHMIDTPTRQSRVRGGFTPPERFARQMRYLKGQDFVFYTASELIAYYRQQGKFPARGITITFDDGCRDNYTNAFPVLQALGIKATIFLVPSVIGQVTAKPLAEGEEPRAHLSREEILEMAKHGIEFGSHTTNHKLLHKLSLEEVKYEVSDAKKQIEDLLQRRCETLAYPAGFFTSEVERIVEDVGYTCAFSTVYGPVERTDLYALNRIEILRRDRFLWQFAKKVKPLQTNTARQAEAGAISK
jgi:peptidoglycan/xylan/chitin deacetylase (PgdA/CDA1 family)